MLGSLVEQQLYESKTEIAYATCFYFILSPSLPGVDGVKLSESQSTTASASFLLHVLRWRSSGQLTLLMQLGRQGFQQQLQQFLASYPALLWMSQVQGGMLGQAAGTLGKAAAAEQVSYPEHAGHVKAEVESCYRPTRPMDATSRPHTDSCSAIT